LQTILLSSDTTRTPKISNDSKAHL